MLRKWLKKVLGVNELESKVESLIQEKESSDIKVIKAEQSMQLIENAAKEDGLNSDLTSYLSELNVKLSEDATSKTLIALNAADIVQKYDLKRYAAPLRDKFPTRVISMKEFRDNPEK